MALERNGVNGLVRFLSTSYCFYVLLVIAVIEYSYLIHSIGSAPSLSEVQLLVRYSPPLEPFGGGKAVTLGEISEAPPQSIVVGDATSGCRVRWSHPRQSWDGFNLPCPPAIAEQLSRKADAFVQVATVIAQNRHNNKAQCVLVKDEWYCMPNFLVIGAPFAGSRTLKIWMAEHPRIIPPSIAYSNYLDKPKDDTADVWSYFSRTCPTRLAMQNPTPLAGTVSGELNGDDHGPDLAQSPWTKGDAACYDYSPSLFSDSKAPITTMRAPWARTAAKIVLLRDPAERVIAEFFAEHPDYDWKDLEYAVKVSSGDFRECACARLPMLEGYNLCAEASLSSSSHGLLWPLMTPSLAERVYTQCKRHLEDTFLHEGFYFVHMNNWLQQGFKPSQFQLVFFNDLKHSPMETMSSVFQQLGLGLRGAEIAEMEQRLVANYGRTSFPDTVPKAGMKSKEAASVRKLLRGLYAAHDRKFNELTMELWGVEVPWL